MGASIGVATAQLDRHNHKSEPKVLIVGGEFNVRTAELYDSETGTFDLTKGDANSDRLQGESREAFQPRALAEPDKSLSTHPAPIIRPFGSRLQWANSWGLRRLTACNQFQLAIRRPRNLLYLRMTHRTRKSSIVRSSLRSFEG
jgi:hypothetical protein